LIEVLPCIEILRLADPAERLEDEAVAVRRGGVDVRKELVLPHYVHALERDVDYLRV
jgi:hypothetical protein